MVRCVEAARQRSLGTAQDDPTYACRNAGRVPATVLTSGQNMAVAQTPGPALVVRHEHTLDGMAVAARSSSHRESAPPGQRLAAAELAANEKPTEAR